MVEKSVIIALGGNALAPSTGSGTIAEQFAQTRASMKVIMPFVRQGFGVAITHGNGPQVGDELRRVELSEGKVPALPLGVAVAATQGTIGYMIEQSLQNALLDEDIHRDVVSLITQVLVRADDPAITRPTKFIGEHYPQARAEELSRKYGWHIGEQSEGIWRRVVGSPTPLRINNGVSIKRMVDAGVTGLSVSVDGDQAVHDAIRLPAKRSTASSYQSALRAISLSAASSLKTAVITQVHRGNIDDLPRMVEQMIELGVDAWQVQICMPLGRLLKHRHKYLIDPAQIHGLQEQLAGFIDDGRLPIVVADNIGYYGRREPTLRRSAQGTKSFWAGCMAGCRVLACCANGDIKGCPSHPREFVVGNIRNTPLAEIWGDPQRFAYNTAFKEERLEGGCARCPFRRICRAGCTSMAYAVTGTIYDNPFCIQRAPAGDGLTAVTEDAEASDSQ